MTLTWTGALTKIKLGDETVEFKYDDTRKDHGGKRLNRVVLMRGSNILRGADILYDEVKSNKSIQDPELSHMEYLKYRYFLKQVNFFGENNLFDTDYHFDYHMKEHLPPRFSFSRDKFGYFNERANRSPFSSEAVDDNTRPVLIQAGGIGEFSADLDVNESVVSYGLLNRISYPTGGYTEVHYEAHKSLGEKVVRSPVSEHMTNSLNCSARESTKKFRFLSTGKTLKYSLSAEYDTGPNNPCELAPDPLHDRYSIKIVDVAANTIVHTASREIGEQLADGEVNTEGGKIYEVSVTLTSRFNALYASAMIDYDYNEETVVADIYGGGARLSKLVDYDGSGVNERKFYYNSVSSRDDTKTSMEPIYAPISYVKGAVQAICSGSSTSFMTYRFSNSNLEQFYSLRSGILGYQFITFSDTGNGNENKGFTEKEFEVMGDQGAYSEFGPPIFGIAYSNFSEEINGNLKKKTIYDASLNIRSEEFFEYDWFERQSIRNWVFRKNNDLLGGNPNGGDRIRFTYSAAWYENVSKAKRIKRHRLNFYSPNGEISTTELIYSYEGKNHHQVSKKVKQTSKDQPLSIEYSYPKDLLSSGLPFISDLNNQNRFEPIITKVSLANKILSERRMEHQNQHNLIVLSRLSTIYGQNDDRNNTHLTFSEYDVYGNPTEVQFLDGPSTVYLWGYGGQYPIAKIEYASMDQVRSALGSSATTILNNLNALNVTDATINQHMKTLRDKLTGARVSSFTYTPLSGMTSMTDPRGITEYYQYDGFQRLKDVLDFEKNVLMNYQYHYRP